MKINERLLFHPCIMLDPSDEAGETPLMWAVKEGNSDAVWALLREEANSNIPNEENRTPLHEAMSAPNVVQNIVSRLLANNAESTAKTTWDRLRLTIWSGLSTTTRLFCSL